MFVYRPRIRGKKSLVYYGQFKIEGVEKPFRRSLGVKDKQNAWKRLSEVVEETKREINRRRTGCPELNERTTLEELIGSFVETLRASGRDAKYLENSENRLNALSKEIDWKTPADLSKSSLEKWRVATISGANVRQRSAKTINDFTSLAKQFADWLVEIECIESNPLARIQPIKRNGTQTFERRAFTTEELRCLVLASGPRGIVYLFAAHTGLRRAEIDALLWSDFHLETDAAYVVARASTTKNGKRASIPLHGELIAPLRDLKQQSAAPSDSAFGDLLPSMQTFKEDLNRAGIEYVDSESRRADFHALRHTLATRLAVSGIAPRVSQDLMRHTDIKLTLKNYTDPSHLPIAEAVRSLPAVLEPEMYAVKYAVDLGSEGQPETPSVTDGDETDLNETRASRGDCRALSQEDATCPLEPNGGEGRNRTYRRSRGDLPTVLKTANATRRLSLSV